MGAPDLLWKGGHLINPGDPFNTSGRIIKG